MEQKEKLTYLDGIKVIAAILIFNTHFLNAYYPGIYTLNAAQYHMKDGLEWILGTTPLNFFYAGKFGVRTFMVLSGFLAARQFLITKDEKVITSSVVKKYFRLVLPILTVNILVVILMALGCYHNEAAAVLAKSEDLFASYNAFSPNIFAAIYEAVWGAFIHASNTYNGPLWFIYYEFFGTLLVAGILATVGKVKARYPIYAVTALILIRSDFLAFILGMIVCDLAYTQADKVAKLAKHQWLMWLLLIVSLFMGTYPSIGTGIEGTIYSYLPPKVLLYYNVFSAAMLFAIMQLKPAQKVLSFSGFHKFNQISYCFYLVHFPILCTLSSWIFIQLQDSMNYHVLAVLNYAVTFSTSALVAWILTKSVDKPGIAIAKKVSQKLL